MKFKETLAEIFPAKPKGVALLGFTSIHFIGLVLLAVSVYCGQPISSSCSVQMGALAMRFDAGGTTNYGLHNIAVACLIASAAAVVGILAGFLFGIPKTPKSSDEVAPQTAGQPARRLPNTNLEEISDWLTKVIVGVGLTQYGPLLHYFKHVCSYLSNGLILASGPQVAGVVTMVAIVFFAINGFISSWICTRLYLGAALDEADRIQAAVTSAVKKEMEAKMPAIAANVSQGINEDRTVENYVIDWLEPGLGALTPTAEDEADLFVQIERASDPTKARIFYRAKTARSNLESAREPANSIRNERVISVFKALIACDKNDVFHRNHGQLAYALKYKGAWKEAIVELDKAIELRDKYETSHALYLRYEFNRADCRSKLTPNPDPETIALIIQDLKKAATNSALKEIIEKELPQYAQAIG